jgi:hypothetical protein
MKYKLILVLTVVIFSYNVFGTPNKQILTFRTSNGHFVKVFNRAITFDSKTIFKLNDDEIIYNNAANKLIEDHGVAILFLAIDDRPNLEKLDVFIITPQKATLVAKAILSPIKDYDHDGYLEFGGRDLTEVYPNPDSMYYVRTAYYEIRDGKINLDMPLTRRKDIDINGTYIPVKEQLDKDGFCCKVIPKPKGKLKKD